jgi:hypothetical protein
MKALVLIPCSASKRESTSSRPFAQPLEGLSELRKELAVMVRNTPTLINKSENSRNLLGGEALKTQARDLYVGRLYQPCRGVLKETAVAKNPSIHILIVSALYGLVRLDEGLVNYQLAMSAKLVNGKRVAKYWQASGLSSILTRYAKQEEIRFVWSLLPKSGYHYVFSEFWLASAKKSIECYRVDIPGLRQASGGVRGQWLEYIIRNNPKFLFRDPEPPTYFPEIPKYYFAYPRC